MNTLLIFLGAGLGGVLRFWTSQAVYFLLGRQFPYGTLVVNVTGSFAMGFLFILIAERVGEIAPQLRSLLLIGVLGGYTTFSSFSVETMSLIENGAWTSAVLNIVMNVILCLAATWIGLELGRQL